MHPFSTVPRPDVSCRLSAAKWSNKPVSARTAPSTFIGEAKFYPDDDDMVLAQIAMSMHPNLLILALYYLDHRKHSNDPIPAWLFLFGIRYFANGFNIYAHYFDWNAAEERFKFHSVPLANGVFDALGETPSNIMNMKAVSALGSLRSHSYFVAKQLLSWKGNLRDKYLDLSLAAT
jgi:hypothetical protein